MRAIPIALFVPLTFSIALGAIAQAPVAPPASPPSAAAATSEPAQLPAAARHIRAEDLLAHATWLASDERGGRLTGSPGQEEAARYIAAHFEKLGLEPLGDVVDGKTTFFQRYGIERTRVLDSTVLQLGALELREGFAVLGGRPRELELTGTLRFCGLGRTRGNRADLPEEESLAGKIAVVAVQGPRGRVPTENLTVEQKFGLSFGTFGKLGNTSKALAKRGAAAVVFVQHADPIGLSDVLNYLALSPGKDSLAARFEGAEPGMGGLGNMLGDDVPAFVLSVPASQQLFEQLGLDPAAVAAFVQGDGEMPAAETEVAASIKLGVAHDAEATACNVVAVLRGSDPDVAEEAVVYSAHMDHVGRRVDGDVFNGADDNASGSAGLLGIATAFARAEQKPRRSVIFLSVSGEELGLWGSQFFADNPTWPADKLIANVNTDMIGRSGPESGPDEVTVTPSNRHPKFSTLVRDSAGFAKELGMSFESGDKYYMRSDHYNFAKKGIPVVFFCNGEHEDYHQVTDHADKLDARKMERIARLAFWTGWAAANADARPETLGRQEDW